jgi:hypothetical protein
VIIASIALAVIGLLGVATAWLLLSLLGSESDHGQTVNQGLYALCYLQMALSAAQIFSAVFVWQGRLWARALALVLCGVNIFGAVISLLSGAELQSIPGVAFNAVLIRTLMGNQVVEWCE